MTHSRGKFRHIAVDVPEHAQQSGGGLRRSLVLDRTRIGQIFEVLWRGPDRYMPADVYRLPYATSGATVSGVGRALAGILSRSDAAGGPGRIKGRDERRSSAARAY